MADVPQPKPGQRMVLITALDKRQHAVPVDTLLRQRGIDPDKPFEQLETTDDGSDVYVQDVEVTDGGQ